MGSIWGRSQTCALPDGSALVGDVSESRYLDVVLAPVDGSISLHDWRMPGEALRTFHVTPIMFCLSLSRLLLPGTSPLGHQPSSGIVATDSLSLPCTQPVGPILKALRSDHRRNRCCAALEAWRRPICTSIGSSPP